MREVGGRGEHACQAFRARAPSCGRRRRRRSGGDAAAAQLVGEALVLRQQAVLAARVDPDVGVLGPQLRRGARQRQQRAVAASSRGRPPKIDLTSSACS